MKTSRAVKSHKHDSPQKISISLFTVSSSRFRDKSLKDDSGEIALQLCKRAGHKVTLEVIDDDKEMIRSRVVDALFQKENDAAITLGGTGVAPRDVTIEALRPLLEKEIDGFGEIFRLESYKSIGSAAMMSRTLAGTFRGKVVFCLPGSPDAAKIGLGLCLKELPHLVFISRSKP
ncbi:MAG: MogA/MoaB family molybdenum cofactor biosynthesis protein [Nitrososphaerales archaeon]